MTDITPWLRAERPAGPDLPRLLCVPYSAKGASLFQGWPAALAGTAEVAAVQLPAREDRLTEPPVADIGELVDHLAPAVATWWREPFVVFAHCMGALVASQLLAALRSDHGLQPAAVILSGTIPAWQDESEFDLSGLSDAALIRRLREHGALTPRMLAEPAVLTFMLPAARADSALCDTVRRRGRPAEPVLSCPLVLFAGRDDSRFRPAEMLGWSALTSGPVELREFAGDHTFLDADPAAVIDATREIVAGVRAGAVSSR